VAAARLDAQFLLPAGRNDPRLALRAPLARDVVTPKVSMHAQSWFDTGMISCMDEVPIPYRESDGQLFSRVLAYYSAPAYIRRARKVEDAFEALTNTCTRRRQEWLKDVRSRLASVCRLIDDWTILLPYFADEGEFQTLRDLCSSLGVTISSRADGNARRSCRRPLEGLRTSTLRFNRRWQAYVIALDLTAVNELRDGYNRYYLLEKECAVRSARLARQGFRRLAPITASELLALFPLLPVPASQYQATSSEYTK